MKVPSTGQSSISCLRAVTWLLCLSFLLPTGLLANQEAPVPQMTSVPRTEKSEPVFSFSGKKIFKRFAEKRTKGIVLGVLTLLSVIIPALLLAAFAG